MKKPTALPDAIRRRNVLYAPEVVAEVLVAYADLYREAGNLLDALEFYARAEHADGLAWIVNTAVEEGDAFLVERWQLLTGEALPKDRWATLAANAEARGATLFARRAYTHAGQLDKAAALDDSVPSDVTRE